MRFDKNSLRDHFLCGVRGQQGCRGRDWDCITVTVRLVDGEEQFHYFKPDEVDLLEEWLQILEKSGKMLEAKVECPEWWPPGRIATK